MERLVYAEWGWPEYRATLHSLLRRPDPAPALQGLVDRLAALYGDAAILPVNRGRHGLEIALRSFAERAPRRTEVIYPGYICRSVIQAITRSGLTPRPVDVASDLNIDPALVEEAVGGGTLAVVAPHMYGCPARIGELEAICRRRGVFLVDDAAQVVGVSVDGRPLGTFGDVGIVSFCQSKTIVAGSGNAGGLLLVNNRSLLGPIEERWAMLPPGLYSLGDFGEFLRTALLEPYLARPHYYLEALRKRMGVSPHQPSWPMTRMSHSNAAIAACQLDSLTDRLRGRIAVAALYAERLKAYPELALPQYGDGRYLTRVMIALPAGTPIASTRRCLRRAGIGTRLPYEVAATADAPLPIASDCSSRLLELPSASSMGARRVAAVVTALAEALGCVVVSGRQPVERKLLYPASPRA
jgi:dTDP-4-amino-4,6-dideoxygalactose transaminase